MSQNVKDIVKLVAPIVVAIAAYLLQVDPLDLCRPSPVLPAADNSAQGGN